MAGVPLAGGLVGYASYDVVRFFERLPARSALDSGFPVLHYAAPKSLLVFDHLTRGIALLHDGTEAERQSLRKEVIRALRGALPNGAARRQVLAPRRGVQPAGSHGGREARAGVHRRGGCVSARALRALRRAARSASVRGVSRAALHQSVAVHVLLRARRCHGRRLLARSAREAQSGQRRAAAHRRHAAARGRYGDGHAARSGHCARIRKRTPST